MPFRQRRKKFKVKHQGKLALKKVNKLMKSIERKRIDVSASTTINTSGIIVPLSLTEPGTTGAGQRIGNKISLSSVLLNYSIRLNLSDDFTNIRVMLVKDKQVNGANFVLSDLLQYTSLETAITSPYDLDGALRFKVLYDKVHSLNAGARPNMATKTFRGLGGILARYTGSTPVISGVENTGITLVAFSDEDSNPPVFIYQTRVRFRDA